MIFRKAILASIVGISFAACGGGIAVNTDYDPAAVPSMAAYKTFSWLPTPKDQGDLLTSARIKAAVDNQLAAKGFRRIEGDAADFRVRYILAFDGKVDYSTTATEWVQGTLAIDIVDGKKNEVVYRTVSQAEVTPDLSPAERSKRVNEAVLAMLKDFPPK